MIVLTTTTLGRDAAKAVNEYFSDRPGFRLLPGARLHVVRERRVDPPVARLRCIDRARRQGLPETLVQVAVAQHLRQKELHT